MFLVGALCFVATMLLVMGVFHLVGPRPERRRLVRLADGTTASVRDLGSEPSMLARPRRGWLSRLAGRLGGSTSRETETLARLRERMTHAGFRSESAVGVYLGSRILFAIGVPLLFLLTPATFTLEAWRLLAIIIGLGGIGWVLPSWWLDRRMAMRQGQVERGLPDALDLMVVCVEAGFGVNASLARVAREFATTNPVLSAEMELVTLEIRAGKATVDALRALADRTGAADVGSLVSLLVQTSRFGTSVADALRVHADSMRVRRMQRAEERAGKAPLKMIFPTVVIFLATMIVLLTPAVIRFNGMFED